MVEKKSVAPMISNPASRFIVCQGLRGEASRCRCLSGCLAAGRACWWAAAATVGRYNAIPGSVERFGGIGVCVRAGMLVPLPVRTGEKSSQTRFFFEIPGCLTEKIARSAARAADRRVRRWNLRRVNRCVYHSTDPGIAL